MATVELASENSHPPRVRIKVIGVGGGGGNAINNMVDKGMNGVTFIAANTDEQVLTKNKAHIKIQLGPELTRGKGAGGDPNIGREAVSEVENEIKSIFQDTDMLFITATMGGGTGTGAAPRIASIAKELDILTVGIVTRPFTFEGAYKVELAEKGISELRKTVDALIVLSNDKLIEISTRSLSFKEAFKMMDDVLYQAASGISDMIVNEGFMNIDFADVRAIMKHKGDAIMTIGTGSGENRATEAAQNALNSKFLEGISISGAKGVLLNFTCGKDFSIQEIHEAASFIYSSVGENAFFKYGIIEKEELGDLVQITLVATGLNHNVDILANETTTFTPTIKEKNKIQKAPYTPQSLFDRQKEIINPITSNSTKGNDLIHTGRFPINKPLGLEYNNEKVNGISCPTGPSELKKYDQPSYERRTIVYRNNNIENNIIPNNYLIHQEEATKEKLSSEYPAFLRKQID